MADTHAELRDKIKRALADARSDQALLERLSELAKDWRFAGKPAWLSMLDPEQASRLAGQSAAVDSAAWARKIRPQSG